MKTADITCAKMGHSNSLSVRCKIYAIFNVYYCSITVRILDSEVSIQSRFQVGLGLGLEDADVVRLLASLACDLDREYLSHTKLFRAIHAQLQYFLTFHVRGKTQRKKTAAAHIASPALHFRHMGNSLLAAILMTNNRYKKIAAVL